MLRSVLSILLFIFCFTIFGQNNLNEILELEDRINSEKFLDTILSLPFSDKTSDSSLFLILAKKANAIAYAKKDTLKLAQSHEDLALCYHFTNKFDLSIENTIKAANYYYQIKEFAKYGNCYVNLGWRINRRDLDKGLFYMMKGINILKKYEGDQSIPMIGAYNNYGALKQRNLERDSALYYHKKSYELCSFYKDSLGMPYAMVEMAQVYRSFNQIEKAKSLLDDALKIRLKLEDNYGIADSYERLGNHFFELKAFEKAINAYNTALIMTNEYSFNYMKKNISEKLYLSYYKRNNYKKAFQFLKLNKQLVDSTNSLQIENKIRQLEIQFKTTEKEKELLQTRAAKAETELALSETKTWTFLLLGSLAVLLFMGVAIFQRNKRKHQLAIANQKEKNLEAILFAEEKERTRIARELHDGVVQQIGSTILKTRTLFSQLKITENNASQEVLETLENSNKDIRNISHQMMPRALSELGLISAIDDLLKGSLEYANIDYNFEHFNLKERLSEKIEITLYRITQELINNIIKHSKAKSVSIQLINSKEHILLIIEDDGVGIDTSKTKKGIGFANIKSRLAMINGEANFDKSPEKGTLVTVKIRKEC